MRVKKLCVVK